MEDLSQYNPEGSDLRKAQIRMLEILDIFAAICEKHKIDYWLYAGTVLGAKRHKGFIPWDDDLDVLVLQKDYLKLMKAIAEELPSEYKLQNRKTDRNYKLFYSKIRDLNSVFHEPGTDNYKYKGIFIDIFTIEKVPSLKFKIFVDALLNSPHALKDKATERNKLRYLLMIPFIPLANLMVWYSRNFFDKKDKGVYQYGYGIRDYKFTDISLFYPIAKADFEGKKYNVPGNLSGYLSRHFGDNYMQIPEKNKRRIHAPKIEVF